MPDSSLIDSANTYIIGHTTFIYYRNDRLKIRCMLGNGQRFEFDVDFHEGYGTILLADVLRQMGAVSPLVAKGCVRRGTSLLCQPSACWGEAICGLLSAPLPQPPTPPSKQDSALMVDPADAV